MFINVGRKTQQYNTHYDANEFTITLLLQEADEGDFLIRAELTYAQR